MPELLNTDEAAQYLRMSERKLYDLVASGDVPCSKVTGRWLFPKAALDRWVTAGMSPDTTLMNTAPPIVGGSHDPLLEWALRESQCGLASLPEGSETGLRRLVRREVMIAAIHLHALSDDDENANIGATANLSGLHDAVVIAFARREQGLVVAPGNPLKIDGIGSLSRRRLARRQDGAGAHLLLLSLLRQAGISYDQLTIARPDCVTGSEIAERIRAGEADCGIATRAAAHSAGMDFVPLVWENFDLVLRQRDYFLAGPQAMFGFARSERLRARAAELGGYDLTETGRVRHVN
jgi:putative molybdopterin biosynthesis protein